MLKLFRKYSEHLKVNWFNYGLDTFVVIVGILIALGLNNWNEERKTKAVTKEYLSNIKDDLILDTLALRRQDSLQTITINRLEKYYDFYQTGKWTLDQIVDSCLLTSFEIVLYFPINNTYSDMLSSGKTGLLDDDIRNKLSQLKKKQDALTKILNEINEMIMQNIHGVETYWDMERSGFTQRAISNYREPVPFFDNNINPEKEENLLKGLKYHHNIHTWMYHSFHQRTEIGNGIVMYSREIMELIDKEVEN